MKHSFTVLFLFLYCAVSQAQLSIEPIFGYNVGLNNLKYKFKLPSVGVNFSQKLKNGQELFLQFQYAPNTQFHSIDSSFTPNPALPLYAPAYKSISLNFFSISMGGRITFIRLDSVNSFGGIGSIGYGQENFSVDYSYDKTNYTILNSDRSENLGGLYIAMGVEYLRQMKQGRLFAQINFIGMSNSSKNPFPNSFTFLNLVSFNVGYSIPILHYHEKE